MPDPVSHSPSVLVDGTLLPIAAAAAYTAPSGAGTRGVRIRALSLTTQTGAAGPGQLWTGEAGGGGADGKEAAGPGMNTPAAPASPATTLDTWSAWTALATAAQMTKGFVWHGVSMAMRVQPQFPDAGLPSPQFFWFTEWEVGYGGGAAPAAPATIAAGYAESGGAHNATTGDPGGAFFPALNDPRG